MSSEELVVLRGQAAAMGVPPDRWNKVPVVVVTAKDLTAEDRQRLNGYVEKVVQKGSYSAESLMNELRGLVTTFARPEHT